MTLAISSDANGVTVRIPPDAAFEHAAPLRDALLEHGQAERIVRLRLDEVERVSVAVVEVLLSAVPYFRDRGARLVFVDPSATFVETLSGLGFYDDLMTWDFNG